MPNTDKKYRLKVVEMRPYTEEEREKHKVELSRNNRNDFGRMDIPTNEFELYEFLNVLSVELTADQWQRIRNAVIKES